MDRWAGKVAIITGASSGIGAAIAKTLVNHGVNVVGLARRLDRLQELATTLGKNKFYPVQCDIQKEEEILSAFKRTEELGGADILVNNAGIFGRSLIIESPTSDYRRIIDTNLIAPAICAREFTKSIKKRNVPGHIININSIAGLYAEAITMPISMYSPSKYGLRALGTELRHEFIKTKLKIKVTNISPGVVNTEMIQEFVNDDPNISSNWPMLKDQDIADAAIYALGTPEGAEILEVTVMAQSASIATTDR
ncbi:farnesol dehydrogenase-like [Calliopsis andreniformis]|uniref:farnesol dehydrogenase-like n=1 Tax=Calliopsis andreniformis TaxID=337506 RepID=UPI003FCD5292